MHALTLTADFPFFTMFRNMICAQTAKAESVGMDETDFVVCFSSPIGLRTFTTVTGVVGVGSSSPDMQVMIESSESCMLGGSWVAGLAVPLVRTDGDGKISNWGHSATS